MSVKFLAIVLLGLSALMSCKARHEGSQTKGIIFNRAEPPKMEEGTFLFGNSYDDYNEKDKDGPDFPFCVLHMREGKWEVYYKIYYYQDNIEKKYPSRAYGNPNGTQKDREQYLKEGVLGDHFTPEKPSTISYEKSSQNVVDVESQDIGHCLVDITQKK